MRRARCPRVLRKYGFCGVLALVYACGLKMPRSERAFDALLDNMQKIIGGRPKKRWLRNSSPAAQKLRGGITESETARVLAHYSARCTYSLFQAKADGVTINVNAWLKTVQANTNYIVHTGDHVVFVDVPRVRARWCLYDQSGPKSRTDVPFMKRAGGLLLKKVHSVFTVAPADAEPVIA